MIADQWYYRSICSFRSSLDSVRAVLWVCGVFSFSSSGYSRNCSISDIYCSAWYLCVSLITSTATLYFLIYVAIWLVLSMSHIVRIFHVRTKVVTLVVTRCINLVTSEESWPSSWGVIILPSTSRAELKWSNLFIFVSTFRKIVFYVIGLPTPCPALLLCVGLRLLVPLEEP